MENFRVAAIQRLMWRITVLTKARKRTDFFFFIANNSGNDNNHKAYQRIIWLLLPVLKIQHPECKD